MPTPRDVPTRGTPPPPRPSGPPAGGRVREFVEQPQAGTDPREVAGAGCNRGNAGQERGRDDSVGTQRAERIDAARSGRARVPGGHEGHGQNVGRASPGRARYSVVVNTHVRQAANHSASPAVPFPSPPSSRLVDLVTNPSRRSRRCASAPRSSGSPHPPPPPERTWITSPRPELDSRLLGLQLPRAPPRRAQRVAVGQPVAPAVHPARGILHPRPGRVPHRRPLRLKLELQLASRPAAVAAVAAAVRAELRGGGSRAGSAPRPPPRCRT